MLFTPLVPLVLFPLALNVAEAESAADEARSGPAPAVHQQRRHHGLGLSRYEQVLELACEVVPVGKDVPKAVLPFRETFGRAIPIVGPSPSIDDLKAVAALMDQSKKDERFNDSRISAGLIFFGQFVDHDVTLEAVSKLAEATDPADAETIRTPRLDLDSVYLDGPEASAFLYDPSHHGRLITGTDANELDLPRSRAGTALIGDPRNDENTVIAQLHLMFLRFHNVVLTDVEGGAFDEMREPLEDDFELAQRIVRWHYQWIVQNEFLPAVVDKKVLAMVQAQLEPGKKTWVRDTDIPAFPIEFSAAAYRFGHSQIRGSLRLQRNGEARPLLSRTGGLSTFGPIPEDQVIDWSLFFRMGRSRPQPAHKLDTLLVKELLDLPFVTRSNPNEIGDENLAFRNLQRGSLTFALPTGEEAFGFLKQKGLTTRNAAIPQPVELAPLTSLKGTPLWFYCLHEAKAFDGRLGDVGGTIVAATLLRMLTHDPDSFLAQDDAPEVVDAHEAHAALVSVRSDTGDSGDQAAAESMKSSAMSRAMADMKTVTDERRKWEPFLGSVPGRFSMAELILFVEASEGL